MTSISSKRNNTPRNIRIMISNQDIIIKLKTEQPLLFPEKESQAKLSILSIWIRGSRLNPGYPYLILTPNWPGVGAVAGVEGLEGFAAGFDCDVPVGLLVGFGLFELPPEVPV
jgi:hypothetical protein